MKNIRTTSLPKALVALLLAILMIVSCSSTAFAAFVEDGYASTGRQADLAEAGANEINKDGIYVDISACSDKTIDGLNCWWDTGCTEWGEWITTKTDMGNYVYYFEFTHGSHTYFRGFKVEFTDGTKVSVAVPNNNTNDKITINAARTSGSWGTYTAPLPKLGTPSLKYNNETNTPVDLEAGQNATLTWTAVSNASSYTVFKDENVAQADIPTNSRTYTATSTGLYTVKAIGDGTTYSDSDASNAIQVNIPIEFYIHNVANWDVTNTYYYTFGGNNASGGWEGTCISGDSHTQLVGTSGGHNVYKVTIVSTDDKIILVDKGTKQSHQDGAALADGKVYATWANDNYAVITPTNFSDLAMDLSVSKNPMTNGDVEISNTSPSSGTSITLTIKPSFGYELDSISAQDSDSQNVVLSGSGNANGSTRTFTIGSKNVTVSATFTAISTTKTFYVCNSDNWSSIYYHIYTNNYNGNNYSQANYPGTQINSAQIGTINGKPVYSVTVPSYYEKIILTDNNGHAYRGNDSVNLTNGKLYYTTTSSSEASPSIVDYSAGLLDAPHSITVTSKVKTAVLGEYGTTDTDVSTINGLLEINSTRQTSINNAQYGDSITITAPNRSSQGYVFMGWYEGNSKVEDGLTYTFTKNDNNDRDFVARYDRKYTLTINAGSNGKVGTNQSSLTKPVFYEDTPEGFAIAPSTGYEFDATSSTNFANYYTFSSNTATGKTVAAGSKTSATVTVAFKKLTYTITGSCQYNDGSGYTAGANGGSISISENGSDGETDGSAPYAYNEQITVTATAASGYAVTEIEYSINGTDWETVQTLPTKAAATTSTTTMTNDQFRLTNTTTNTYFFRASFKKVYEASFYMSYYWDHGRANTDPSSKDGAAESMTNEQAGMYIMKAAAPATYSVNGGDPVLYEKDASNTMAIKLFAGDVISFRFSNLASSDLITQVRGDDVSSSYTLGNPKYSHFNHDSSDSTNYGYAGTARTAGTDYTYDPAEQTVTFTMTKDWKNNTVVLGNKYKIYINGDNWSGLKLENNNDECYYYSPEVIEHSNANHSTGFKIKLDNETDTTKTYRFTAATASALQEDGTTPASGVTVKAYDSSNNETADVANIDHWLIYGTMPAYDVYVTIGVEATYNMKLSNFVISDEINHKLMLTQTTNSDYSNGTTAPSSPTGNVGTITAVVKDSLGNVVQADISSDNDYHWVCNDSSVSEYKGIYEDNNFSKNYYLMGGVNKTGAAVADGCTVTYTYTPAAGMNAEYSFVGWYEGTYNSDTRQFTPNYNKKLSGKESFTFTPTMNTVVIAVGTKDMYLGGSFDKDGNYSTSDTTWTQNRILMSFDPTYVNGQNRGRYFYTFSTVDTDALYEFRCYDAQGDGTSDVTPCVVWGQKNSDDYTNDNADAWEQRVPGTPSTGKFKLTSTNVSNGYAAPVTLYFYAYDGGFSVDSTYQWSKAYVSAGAGVDVKNATSVVNSDATATFNTPSVEVRNTTENGAAVDGTATPVAFGGSGRTENVYVCTVHEDKGVIRVTACPQDDNLDVAAFVVYNIDTKDAKAVLDVYPGTAKTIDGTSYNTFYADITVSKGTNVYIVPVYKFTDAYMSNAANKMEEHTVYVNTEDLDRTVWGGLVSMYSWGTNEKLSSGVYPGQLLIPSDDGNSFYGQLQYYQGGLGGVLFNNYVGSENNEGFIGKYYDHKPDGGSASTDAERVSTTLYCTGTANVQTYDYREPISIIDNVSKNLYSRIYDDNNVDLTFALKKGNKIASPSNDATSGVFNPADPYANVASWQYLMNRNGTKRVDLNGEAINTNPTHTYSVVCHYTKAYDYNSPTKTYAFFPGVKNQWSIDWYVYDNTDTLINSGSTSLETSGQSGTLSAAYTDIYENYMLTDIAAILAAKDKPISGKAVRIAYENPTTFTGNTVRYSGQWYHDGVNSPITANVRVGILADGTWLPSATNAPGYATATFSIDDIPVASRKEFEAVGIDETGTGCTAGSKATVIKSHGKAGLVSLTVDKTEHFQGWYYQVKNEDGSVTYKQISEEQTIHPSFNADITYYAFYSANATYRFEYTDRHGNTKVYTVMGDDLTDAELSAGGTLNTTARASDITSKLGGINQIKVFNRTFTYPLTSPDTSKAYQITYSDPGTVDSHVLTVKAYNDAGTALEQKTTVSGTWAREVNIDSSILSVKPKDHPNYVFVGWKKEGTADSAILSTQANFGYSVVEDMTIVPVFGPSRITAETWTAGIDKNGTTQELTSADAGTLYNDSLISFRFAKDTGTQPDLTGGKECGIVILTQTAEATANETSSSNFTALTKANLQAYLNYMNTNSLSAAKMNSKFGDSYAFVVKADELSRLNRADVYQALDYAKFRGGNFKVMSYYYDGTSYVVSDVTSGTLTPAA